MHLLHPGFVHVSVAFLVIGGAIEIAGLLSGREGPRRFGGSLVLIGTASLIFTVATGFLARNSIDVPPGAATLLARHENLGLAVLAVFFGSQFWKGWARGEIPARWRRAYAALLLLGVVLVVWTAFLGGEMVYLHAVGVEPGHS